MKEGLKEFKNKTFTIIGILFLIFAIIGIITSFALPWWKVHIGTFQEFEGETRDYYYGDFGEEFEEDSGDNYDGYYHGKAFFTLVGFFIILIMGILFIIDGMSGKLSDFFLKNISRPRTIEEANQARTVLYILVFAILIVPSLLIIIGGTNFVGNAISTQASWDSSIDDQRNREASFDTPAGTAATVIGLIILIVCLLYLHLGISQTQRIKDSNPEGFQKSNKLKKYAFVILFLTIIGMIAFPLIAFVEDEYKWYYQYDTYDGGTEVESFNSTWYIDDASVHLLAKIRHSSSIEDDLYEDMDRHLGMVSWSLVIILFIALIAISGLVFFRNGSKRKIPHIFMFFGIFIILFSITIFAGFGLFVGDVGELDKEFEKLARQDIEYYYYGEGEIINNANLGSNFIPVAVGIIILPIGFLYSRTFWAMSSNSLFGYERSDRYSKRFAKPAFRFSIYGVLFIILILISSTSSYSYITNHHLNVMKERPPIVDYHDLEIQTRSMEESGYLNEGDNMNYEYNFEADVYVRQIKVELRWTDEPDYSIRYDNKPDDFYVEIETFEGFNNESPIEDNGFIEVQAGVFEPPLGWKADEENYKRTVYVNVYMVNAGNHEPRFLGRRSVSDDGNDYDLKVELICYVKGDG